MRITLPVLFLCHSLSAFITMSRATQAMTATFHNSSSSSFIQTTSNCYVSRSASLEGPKFVELKGRSVVQDGVRLCGDRAPIRLHRYVYIDQNTVVEPPAIPLATATLPSYVPVTIGAHTVIGPNSTIRAAAVGSLCWIGAGAVLESRCIVKDCCVVADETIVPADTTIPPFHRVYTGVQGRLCWTELPPSVAVELQERAMQLYHDFVTVQKSRT